MSDVTTLVPLSVMVVLGTTIHEFASSRSGAAHRNSWMVGPSPTMTIRAGVGAPDQCLCVSANAFFCSPLASFWCFAFQSSYGMP